jgi:polysaccharide chain length determinant protein (PEP-CTERM system associated)
VVGSLQRHGVAAIVSIGRTIVVIPGKTYTPSEILKAVRRRRGWIVVPFVLLAVGVLVFVMSLTHNYRSLATVQVLPESASNTLVRATAQPTIEDRLSSIGQETLTRTKLEGIINELGLYPELRRSAVMENIIATMRGDITFQMTDRDVFIVGYTAKDPQTALTVAQRLTALFLKENARNRGQRAEAAMEFLATQLEDARKQLEAQEKRLEGYRLVHAGQLPSQLEANTQELNNTQMRLRSLLDTIGRDRDQRLFLQRQLELAQSAGSAQVGGQGGQTADGGTPDGSPSGATADLARAVASLRALELRLTPEHPDVERAKRQVAILQERAAGEGATSSASSGGAARTSPRLREIQGQIEIIDRQLASHVREERELRAQAADYVRRVDATPMRESELAALSRDYDDTKRLYSSLLQRQQEATMAADLERKDIGDRFRVIEPARLPEKPFSPSRRNYLVVGLLVALAFSLCLAAVIEYRDSGLRTEEDVVGSLRLPVLASIPVLNQTAPGRSR